MTNFETQASEISEPRLSIFSKQLEEIDQKIVLVHPIPPAKLCQGLGQDVDLNNKHFNAMPIDPSFLSIGFQRCKSSQEIIFDKHIFQHCSPKKYQKKLKMIN
ncbi:hypothetical protein M0812_11173 [Anaeramoeba flamelloides]|uniref:Uncharacterized protein n=1 Tax=Anaeramoeba flamelloides TaxID=1746091 RepID=A0AAV7ZWW8_9EUKA|nr:hypothetical protein M0812_11173 [Anaeramoeba flamelloides]